MAAKKTKRQSRPATPPNTYVRPSPIHGCGLFAAVDIPAGTRIIHGDPRMEGLETEWMHFFMTKTPSYRLLAGNMCMINHSKTPNCSRPGKTRKGQTMYATRLIKAGEEVTEDYYALPAWNNPFKHKFEEKIFDKLVAAAIPNRGIPPSLFR